MRHLFDECDGSGPRPFDGVEMVNVVFRCARTGEFVQLSLDEVPDTGEHLYLPVNCPACGKTHFVNRSTHKLLGHEDE